MRLRFWAARAAALALVLGGLSAANGLAKAPRAHPPLAAAALYQSGLATWYGPEFEGSSTACGYVYSSAGYTAASNTLPCGAVITVTNADSGAAVTVTVTDRGAFGYPIIVDLSAAAFRAIGDPAHGVINVSITE